MKNTKAASYILRRAVIDYICLVKKYPEVVKAFNDINCLETSHDTVTQLTDKVIEQLNSRSDYTEVVMKLQEDLNFILGGLDYKREEAKNAYTEELEATKKEYGVT